MMKPELTVDVDEFTLVLQSPMKVDALGWHVDADNFINQFLKKSKIEEMFGPMNKAETNLQAGYTNGLTYADRPWYLMICWHDYMPSMGVCVRFSAYAWAAYRQRYKELWQSDIDIWTFLHMVQCSYIDVDGNKRDVYETRLSRIDVVADYKNYPDLWNPNGALNPDSIYTGILRGSIAVKDYRERQTIRAKSGLNNDGAYETFYLGGRRNKANCFLRCYDKRREQIQTNGYRYDEAIACDSWIRFEVVFRHDYAHQITEMLLTQQMNAQDQQRMIAKLISDKYRFYDTALNDAITITNDLIDVAIGAKVANLYSPKAADKTLRQSVQRLKNGSGLYPTLYKFYMIWGRDGEEKLLRYLYQKYVEEFKPKAESRRELNAWQNKHYAELKDTDIRDSL